MKQRSVLAHILVAVIVLWSCRTEVAYIDLDFPDEKPRIFAKGVINVPGRLQQNLTISNDGTEYYFTQTDAEAWRYERILRVRLTDGDFQLDTPQFVREFSFEKEWFIGEPMLSPNEDELFFVANYPPDIWSTRRSGDGDWLPPKRHDFSTKLADWYITFFGERLLFTNGTMYQCEPQDGRYPTSERLRVPFNDFDMRDPVMAPDERFLIFTKEVPGPTGQTDLYVSFQKDGQWTTPDALDTSINTEEYEFAPYISPDQRFLFFSRRDSWQNANYSNIYWVDLEVVTKLAP